MTRVVKMHGYTAEVATGGDDAGRLLRMEPLDLDRVGRDRIRAMEYCAFVSQVVAAMRVARWGFEDPDVEARTEKKSPSRGYRKIGQKKEAESADDF